MRPSDIDARLTELYAQAGPFRWMTLLLKFPTSGHSE